MVQTKKFMSQRTENPALEAICDANVGARTMASEKDMVYAAAYCPLDLSVLRATQKLFIKGNSSISPKVMMIILTTTVSKREAVFRIRKENPISKAPRVK